MKRRWAIAYDIADPRRLQRVARVLEGYGTRVQRSVFECCLDITELQTLRDRIVEEIEYREDSVRLYPLCSWCYSKIETQGVGKKVEDSAYIIV